MTPLTCFDVSTSKKLREKSGRYVWFADKAATHGLKSALSYFVLFDILTSEYISSTGKKLQSAGPKLHLNITPASHTHTYKPLSGLLLCKHGSSAAEKFRLSHQQR